MEPARTWRAIRSALLGLALGGCASAPWARSALPTEHTVVRDQLVIHSDFALPASHRLLTELSLVRSDLRQRLDVPNSDEPIQVYLFQNEKAFRDYLRVIHPFLPDRRAFFIETDTRLQIFAQWGDRLGEDLRHEATHGFLHSSIPNMPLWLDEGLAEYYEMPRGAAGLNRVNLDRLLQGLLDRRWQADLARLEALAPDASMSQLDYAEAWAWAHFLLETCTEHRALLRDYLAELRTHGAAEPISVRLARLLPQPGPALVAYVQNLPVK